MHAMIDFETLSLAHNAALISCGIVLFNSKGIHDSFYINIAPHAEQHVMQSTVDWWAKQSAEAKVALEHDKVEFSDAMKAISDYLRQADILWANGATADIVWLESALSLAELENPVSYRGYRCYRTAMALKPNAEWTQPTVAHNALEDAKAQALTLINAYGEELDNA